jgi:hypothetical protein
MHFKHRTELEHYEGNGNGRTRTQILEERKVKNVTDNQKIFTQFETRNNAAHK